MSENSSEYLKRTCLICGCHTNQTINIYEPRSGPNIVQLIQAKFKFQPLNEDKYLCFSCNNWLINWHSLQALNSNDAESPSGTFRSHLNSGNVMQDEKSSGSKKQIAVCRPIAKVKPWQQLELQDVRQVQQENGEFIAVEAAQDFNESHKSTNKINFNKRNFRVQLTKRGGTKMQQKVMQQCTCGKKLVVRSNKKISKQSNTQTTVKCRKCRELYRSKACYLRSIIQVEKELAQREAPLLATHTLQNLVIETETQTETKTKTATTNVSQSINQQQQQQLKRHQQCLPKPTIDGKVVSMLRRLGTTLSREPQQNGSENITIKNLPQIMSPIKPKAKWLRRLDDDEILVNFDTNISEVLPSLADQFTNDNIIAAKKRLTFQISQTPEVIDLCDDDESVSKHVQELTEIDTDHDKFTSALNLPKSLTIALI